LISAAAPQEKEAISTNVRLSAVTVLWYFYCLNFWRRNLICFIQGISPYRAVNTFHHGYKNQSVNDVYSKGRCLFWDPYKTLKAKREPCRVFEYYTWWYVKKPLDCKRVRLLGDDIHLQRIAKATELVRRNCEIVNKATDSLFRAAELYIQMGGCHFEY